MTTATLDAPTAVTETTTTAAPVVTMLSYGGGQDSTALLYKYVYDPAFRAEYAPGRFLVVFSDTGDEHPHTYKHLRETQRFCADHGIEFVWITPDMGYHTDNWHDLRHFYRAGNRVGSKAYPKTCTDNLKIGPIYKYLEAWLGREYGVKVGRKRGLKEFADEHGQIDVLIGIARGEEKRIAERSPNERGWKKTLNVRYPLVDLGMDRADCQAYIAGVGHTVPMPSNCILCPFMNLVELLWLHRHMPDDLQDWIEIEANKIEAWKGRVEPEQNLGVWGKKLLPEKLKEAIEKHDHMTDEELTEYKMSHGHCVASRY